MSSPGFVELLGLSAAVGGGIVGGISALFNYLFNVRDLKKKNKISQIKEKVELYSYLIFQLDRMRFAWHAFEIKEGRKPEESEYEHFVASGSEKEMIREMEKKIEQGYHLFSQEIMKEWAYFSNLFFHPTSIPKIPALWRMLIQEYNDKIIPEYQNLTWYELQKKLWT